MGNAADSLTDLDAPVATMGHYFVKRLLTLALDRKDKEREMASGLLSNLYAEVRDLGHRTPDLAPPFIGPFAFLLANNNRFYLGGRVLGQGDVWGLNDKAYFGTGGLLRGSRTGS